MNTWTCWAWTRKAPACRASYSSYFHCCCSSVAPTSQTICSRLFGQNTKGQVILIRFWMT